MGDGEQGNGERKGRGKGCTGEETAKGGEGNTRMKKKMRRK
jgi:hypothetical protein